jgi:putative ABC transport system permease protein
MPSIYGVTPSYLRIAGLRLRTGRFFDEKEDEAVEAVCVLGEAAGQNFFPQSEAVGQYLKLGEQWFRVIGVVGPRLTTPTEVAGLPREDLNNLVYVPLRSAMLRLEDTRSGLKDEIDALYLEMAPDADVLQAAAVARAILNTSHRNAGDFSLVVPAELLAQQRRTRRIFEMVMVAIASISLLVGGIGIMNIMLASILERTCEIGIRRAVGARRADVLRQFLIEATLISMLGGLLGIATGFGISRLIAFLAGWSTLVTAESILLAFLVSVSIGLIFGIYPAVQAARLDPVEAIRYE